ncbi:serine hydrolase [uncultured Sulfitobacter sp.]|uniref:serine hydrolase domain-containing protein n=1 Tax=uncultured Sulfitobacter sp. TaxID=191468 RepID=UPI00261F0703|nr:serine hydrolase [uncultured Sulfitobacter sp.]
MSSSYKNSEVAPPIMKGAPPPPEQRLPRIDWDRPPWNRWAFQRVQEFLPTAPIRKGEKTSSLPMDVQGIGGITCETESGPKTIDQLVDDTYTDGLLVMIGGKVIHESYYNGMDQRTVHLAQSVSKSITATAGAVLMDQGLIDPQAPITDYLPELEQTAWKGATVQQVLDMTTGVRYEESYDIRDSDIGKTDFASGWKPAPPGVDVTDWPTCVWEQIQTLKTLEDTHGSRFLYRSIETDVLAHAMERVTQMRLPQIISENLWAPMGAEEDANITVDPSGYGLACGGISACLRDFARFGLAMLNDGQVDGRQVIPQRWIDSTRNGAHGLFNENGRNYFPNGAYRNQFWIEDQDKTGHLCLGVFGQTIYVSPERGMVAVKLSTWPDFQNSDFLKETMAGFHAISRAFGHTG